jgi:hypothetical protein
MGDEMRRRSVVLRGFWIWLGLAASMLGQSGPDYDPDVAPGYTKSIFDHKDLDSVNLYNGQLTIPIPVGPSYPIGPNLRFQLLLSYSSRVLEFGWPIDPDPNGNPFTPLVADPSLGVGFNLTAGAVKRCGYQRAAYCYVSQDGAEHQFDGFDANGFAKTTDDSRFYLHNQGATGYEMWDENGNHYVFGWQVSGFDDPVIGYENDMGRGRDGWYLTKLEDPFLNAMTVSYKAGLGSQPCWAGTHCVSSPPNNSWRPPPSFPPSSW